MTKQTLTICNKYFTPAPRSIHIPKRIPNPNGPVCVHNAVRPQSKRLIPKSVKSVTNLRGKNMIKENFMKVNTKQLSPTFYSSASKYNSLAQVN